MTGCVTFLTGCFKKVTGNDKTVTGSIKFTSGKAKLTSGSDGSTSGNVMMKGGHGVVMFDKEKAADGNNKTGGGQDKKPDGDAVTGAREIGNC